MLLTWREPIQITEVALKLVIATVEVKPLKDELKLQRDKVAKAQEVEGEKEDAWRKVRRAHTLCARCVCVIS